MQIFKIVFCRVQTDHTLGIYPGYYPTKNFWKFCRTFTPVPRISGSSVRPCHNTRNFCEFCNTSIPVPEISGSSVRPPCPYPESTNPTEHNLANVVIQQCSMYKPGVVVWLFTTDNAKSTDAMLQENSPGATCTCVSTRCLALSNCNE